MVKKLISGLLKKKDGADKSADTAAESESAENVPEELPPLAEDVLEGKETPPADATSDAAPESTPDPTPESVPEPASDDTPDELPSLDIEEPAAEPASAETPEELPSLDETPVVESATPKGDESALPDAIKKAQAAKQQPGDAPEKQSAPAQPPVSDVSKIPEQAQEPPPQQSAITEAAKQAQDTATSTVSSEGGFFSSILSHIKSNEGSKEKLLGGDLFSRMSTYYELKKGNIQQGTPSQSEQRLESEITKKLEELQTLEQKWQVQKMALEEDVKFLHDRERDIQAKVEELRKLSNEMSMFKNVHPKHYFHMQNGVVLRNLHDLLDALEIIDEETFDHHVSKSKNDFADWIYEAMKNNEFASKFRTTKTKEEMINLLESEPPIAQQRNQQYKHKVPPKKYFWLENGVVIKSLYQLSDALKAMDEELFEKHVDTRKNDFSHWIRDSLRNNELAGKIERARSKKEMADILDIYL